MSKFPTFLQRYTKIFVFALAILVMSIVFFVSRKPEQSKAATGPALPLTYVDTTYPTLSSTRTVRAVKASCTGVSNCYTSLQTAIDQANLGDEIVIDAGLVVTGPITLRNKTTGSGWIIIRTSNMAGIPAAGNRVSPTNAAAMPKIVSPGNGTVALKTEQYAHNYRLVGIEFYENPNDDSDELITLGITDSLCATSTEPYKVCDSSVLSVYPYNLILDRDYIHGDPAYNTKRGVSLNSKAAAIIDSYISDIHVVGQDAQAINGFNGPGPYKIVNNFLSAAAENILFGGDDPRVANLVPSDIEIRNNYFYKPLSWRYGDPSYNGRHWQVKNLLELKNSARVLIDGNIFENNWADAQVGTAILFDTTNQYGRCGWCAVMDTTFTNNIVRHVAGGISIQNNDYEHYSSSFGITQRVKIENNLLYDIDGKKWEDLKYLSPGTGEFAQMTATHKDGAPDVQFNHNTSIDTGKILEVNDCTDATLGTTCTDTTLSSNKVFSQKLNFVFTNNITYHNTYGVFGANTTGFDNPSIQAYYPSAVFTKNVIEGQRSSTDTRDWSAYFTSYPGNYFPTSVSAIGFTDPASDNYQLLSTSPYHLSGSDGKDLGADIAAVTAATVNDISGSGNSTTTSTTPPPPPPPPSSTTDTTPPVVSAFDVQPRTTTSSVTASFSATDSGGSYLSYALLLRAATNSSCSTTTISGCSWVHLTTVNAPANSNSWSGTLTDTPAIGSYLYGVHVYDNAGNVGYEPAIIPVTATSAASLPTASLTASPTGINSGASAMLSWTTANATSVSIDQGIGTVSATGSITITPVSTTTYTLTATNSAGSATASVTVTVSVPAPTASLTASPLSITSGFASTLTWSTTNATQVSIDQGIGQVAASGSMSVSPAVTTTYTLTASNSSSSATSSVTITVAPSTNPADTTPPVISNVAATNINSGSVTITWTTDEPATSQVEYGTTISYGTFTPANNTLTTAHSVTMKHLQYATTYHFRVHSQDAAGNSAVSSDSTFTTLSKGNKPNSVSFVTAAYGSVNLVWTEPATYYMGTVILRSTQAYVATYDASYQIADLPAGTLSYHDTNVLPGTTYYYTLMTYDDARVYSDPVNIAFTTEGTAPTDTTYGASGSFSDGKLLLDTGTIYIVEYGAKRPFVSMSVFSGLGFKLANVVRASTSSLPVGTGIFTAQDRHTRGTLINSDGTVYFMGANLRYAFPSADVFLSWGNQFKDVVPANASDLNVAVGPIVVSKVLGAQTTQILPGMLIKYNGNPTVYLYQNEELHPFVSAKALTLRHYLFSQVNVVDFHSIPIGSPLN